MRPFLGEGVGRVAYLPHRAVGQEHVHDMEANFYGRSAEQAQVVNPRGVNRPRRSALNGRQNRM